MCPPLQLSSTFVFSLLPIFISHFSISLFSFHPPYPLYGVHIFLIHHMSFTSSLSIICMAFPSSLSIIQNFHFPYPLYSVPIFLIHYTAFPSSLSIIRRSHLPYPLNGVPIFFIHYTEFSSSQCSHLPYPSFYCLPCFFSLSHIFLSSITVFTKN